MRFSRSKAESLTITVSRYNLRENGEYDEQVINDDTRRVLYEKFNHTKSLMNFINFNINSIIINEIKLEKKRINSLSQIEFLKEMFVNKKPEIKQKIKVIKIGKDDNVDDKVKEGLSSGKSFIVDLF